MSEEMNLYKRCKNIFKSHGVDMGGGVIFVTTEEIGDSQYISSMSSNEIYEAVMSGNAVYLKVSDSVIALNNVWAEEYEGNLNTSADFVNIHSNVDGTVFMPMVYHIEGNDVSEFLYFIDA